MVDTPKMADTAKMAGTTKSDWKVTRAGTYTGMSKKVGDLISLSNDEAAKANEAAKTDTSKVTVAHV
jgi:hypothetical protein